MRKKYWLIILFWSLVVSARADGLLLSANPDYPGELLRNRMTRVTVDIHGLVAETTVYQEFTNDWTQTVNAVYSFPLPPEARATEFFYWRGDTLYKAVLRVRQQATNPGTGQGGLAAQINQYIGRNGIRIALKGIAPGSIQRVQLHYISHCNYFQGEVRYTYPLNTAKFIQFPLEHLEFQFNVDSEAPITGFEIPTHSGARVLGSQGNRLQIRLDLPKAYPARDLEFLYRVENTDLGVDFFSVANDTLDGHFAVYIRPPVQADSTQVLPKRILFVLDHSSQMFGYPLEQSIAAIEQSLDMLRPGDEFNIIPFSYGAEPWQNAPVAASSANINAARTFLQGISAFGGSSLASALETALAQIPNSTLDNIILVFTNGYTYVDPKDIAARNTYKAGIFAIGIGDDLSRERLEMLSALNYGFVTYFDARTNLRQGMVRVFARLSQPILKEVGVEFGQAGVYDLLPQTMPSTYAGSYFFSTGRYRNPGAAAMAVAGKSIAGVTAYNFSLDFSTDTRENKFAESVWAKEAIDALEREILIYGETEALKDSVIALSLRYNIRCRYTAYVADYKEPATGIRPDPNTIAVVPRSYFIGNYPNPFNPSTMLQFYLGPAAATTPVKLIKIYNALGQLVRVIDISSLQPGLHSLRFDGRDFYGNPLPSGVYFVRLVLGREVITLKIMLAK